MATPTRPVRRVAVTNVYADDNRGGAAITAATVTAVRDAFPGCEVLLVAVTPDAGRLESSYRHTRAAVPDAEIVPGAFAVPAGPGGPARAVARSLAALAAPQWASRRNPVVARLAGADVAVGKGGQLLRAYTWSGLAGFWLSAWPLLLVGRTGGRVALYAVSVGPFHHTGRAGAVSEWVAARILRRCHAVLARDAASLARARALGVPPGRLHLVPDSVFALDAPDPELGASVADRAGLGGSRFAAVTVSSARFAATGDDTLAWLGAVLHRLLDAGAVDRVAVVLQVDGEVSSDRALSAALVTNLDADRVTVVDADLPVAELLALYSRARVTIGGRAHSNIFSIVAGTPPFPFDASGGKARELFDTVGLGDLVLPTDDADGAAAVVLDALHEEAALRARIGETAARLRRDARRAASILAESVR